MILKFEPKVLNLKPKDSVPAAPATGTLGLNLDHFNLPPTGGTQSSELAFAILGGSQKLGDDSTTISFKATRDSDTRNISVVALPV